MEFAIVAPLLFLLIFGLLEFGRIIMVHQILTNASREGARRGVLEQATASEAQMFATDYLTNSTISGATVTVLPEDLSEVGFGDPVTVTVSIPYGQASWLPTPEPLASLNLSATSTMCGERPE